MTFARKITPFLIIPFGDEGAALGGGGKTDVVQVGNTTVTFGHGGRHLEGTNLTTSQVNPVLANDVVSRGLSTGQVISDGVAVVNGTQIAYTAKKLTDTLINIGTYHVLY